MTFLGNLLWFICGGFLAGVLWFLNGIIWCITIIGIPVGKQCFKFAKLSLCPFGKEIVYGGGSISTIANIFWLVISGIPMAATNALIGALLSVTIIGIPFGKQFFKLAKLSLTPFGAEIR